MKKIRNSLCVLALLSAAKVSAQNVYDTYNPQMDSITTTYAGSHTNAGYEGEYQLFNTLLSPWRNFIATTTLSVSYKIEPVSFPFTADCSNGDCGNGSSTTRNMVLISGYEAEDYTFRRSFIGSDTIPEMSDPTTLKSIFFTITTLSSGARDFLPHTVLKHTYYLHYGPTMSHQIIDSFSFVLDHTRGYMSEYPFRSNNAASQTYQHDVTIHPWIIYPQSDSFLTIPPQTTNFLGTIDYFPYPNFGHGPIENNYWNQIPDPSVPGDRYSAPGTYSHPSPYSLMAIMLGNNHEGPFAGTEEDADSLYRGLPHTYYINESLDLRKINPSERIIYNPSKAYITSATPVVFPSGYTFMTVGGLYPTATQVAALDPNNMHGDLKKVPITGSALNLTDNPNTAAADNLSFYYVTSGCTLRIESCVTIYDATIIVQSGGRIELDTNAVYGNYVLQIAPGGTLAQIGSSPTVACKYMCYEESNYNERHVTITTHKTWDTTNLEATFPGTATWSPATSQVVKLVEGITIDSGASLTIEQGVDVLFGPLGKLIVKKGGKLIVEGQVLAQTTFGPACQMEWLGIEVWGDSSLTQSAADTTHQGSVKMEYCIVEHAKTGILSGDPNDPTKSGGVVRAYNSVFYDNVRDVVFLPYRNHIQMSSVTLGNVSVFESCDFRTTEFFYDPALWADYGTLPSAGAYHVGLFDVKNVSFLSCRFVNNNPQNYAPHLRGVGIFGVESGIYLREQSSCIFSGLSDGVWMQASGFSANAINITGAVFEGNIHGIVLEGTRYSAVFKNIIDVPESPQYEYLPEHLEKGYDKPVGIFMLGSVDYRVEENEFNVGDGESQITPVPNCDDCSYDIVVYNTAMLDSNPPIYGTGTVYKNQIHHASMGLQVQGYNGGGNSPDGLEVMCNEFDELVNFDFILNGRIGDPVLPNVNTEIRDQGICDPIFPLLKATNFYLNSCDSTSEQNQAYFGSGGNDYLYSDEDGTRPICRNVTFFECNAGDPDNPCSSRLSSRPYFTGIIFNYATATTNHEAAKHELDSLIDGGDTDALINYIEGNDGADLYDCLMNCSPWLSDDVLLFLLEIENREKLTEEQLVNVLLENARLSPAVWAAVLGADPAFDIGAMTALAAAQATLGSRERKEREWVTWLFSADLAANEITEYAMRTDSLQEGIDALDGTTRISEMQKLFTLHLAARQFADAGTVLYDITQGKETGWSLLAAITLEQQQENRSWLLATPGEVAVADSIWNTNGDRAIGARTISAYYSKEKFSREPFGLEVDTRLGQFPTEEENTENSVSVLMNVFPNPAANSASVIINGLPTTDGTTLEITNTLGQVIETITVKGTAPIELDLSKYAPGMLYLRLVSDGTCISTEKLLIVK